MKIIKTLSIVAILIATMLVGFHFGYNVSRMEAYGTADEKVMASSCHWGQTWWYILTYKG